MSGNNFQMGPTESFDLVYKGIKYRTVIEYSYVCTKHNVRKGINIYISYRAITGRKVFKKVKNNGWRNNISEIISLGNKINKNGGICFVYKDDDETVIMKIKVLIIKRISK